MDRTEGSTSAQLKDDIDSGRTGDKIAGFDPAAAPLGADEEAAGTPPDPRMVERARLEERAGPKGASRNAATPSLTPGGRTPGGQNMALPVLIGVVAAAALLAVLVALLA
ncbi:MAG TPA: hypothetical protein VF138_12360 [Caulobacteraceae bacterium]